MIKAVTFFAQVTEDHDSRTKIAIHCHDLVMTIPWLLSKVNQWPIGAQICPVNSGRIDGLGDTFWKPVLIILVSLHPSTLAPNNN